MHKKLWNLYPEWKNLYLIIKIRNKFSHNQLLSIEDFNYLKTKIAMNEEEKVAIFLNRAFKEILVKLRNIQR